MTKQHIYSIIGLHVGPAVGFFVALFIGASFFKIPLVLAVVLACLFAIYEFFIMKRILQRVDWDT